VRGTKPTITEILKQTGNGQDLFSNQLTYNAGGGELIRPGLAWVSLNALVLCPRIINSTSLLNSVGVTQGATKAWV